MLCILPVGSIRKVQIGGGGGGGGGGGEGNQVGSLYFLQVAY